MPRKKNPSRHPSRQRAGIQRTRRGYQVLTPLGNKGFIAHGIPLKAIEGLMEKMLVHMARTSRQATEP